MPHPPSTFDTHHQVRLGTYETKIVPCDAKHSMSTVSQKNRALKTAYLDLGSVVSVISMEFLN